MIKVAYYARVSTEEEKQLNALEKQVEELEKFIKSNTEWVLAQGYVDEGKSGTTTKNRLAYKQMFDDLLTNKFDILVIKDQSRLMRNVLDWYMFMDRVIKQGKKLYIYLDNQFYTPDNAFITGIKAMMAEEYSRDLSKKIRSAAKRSIENGTAYGNGRIYGYNKVKGGFEINEDEAEIVKYVFEQYSLGKGFRTIQSQLNDKGIHSINGTIFSLSTLKRMISNEKYKGLLVSGKTRNDFETKSLRVTTPEERTYINNGIPAIVDEGLWEKCNQIRKNRVRKYDKNKPNEVFTGYFNGSYPLSNKIFCGKCGESYWHDVYYQAVSKQKVDQWQCRNYKAYGKTHKLGCDGVKLQDKEIMDCLRKVISELSQNKSAYNSNMEYIISLLTKQLKESQSNNQLEKLNQDVTKITNRKDRLMDMLLDGLITKEEFQSKKESLECDLIKIKSEIDEYNKLDYTYQSKANRIEEIRKLLSVSFTKAENISGQVVEEMINKVIILEADKKLVVILNSGSSSANIVGKIDIDKVISSVIVIFNTQCELRKPRCTKTKEIWSVDIGFTV